MLSKFLKVLFIGSVLFVSCQKDEDQEATIIRDCTGTYLQVEGHDYYVCNYEEVSNFSDNETVYVKYFKVDECGLVGVCTLYHPKAGNVEVIEIRR